MTNRRRHHRVKPALDQQFTLRIVDLSFDVEPKNISTGGIFLNIGVSFPIGALMEIELEFEGTSASSLVRVQHRQDDGVGFKFLNPTAAFNDLVGTAVELAENSRPSPQQPFSLSYSIN